MQKKIIIFLLINFGIYCLLLFDFTYIYFLLIVSLIVYLRFKYLFNRYNNLLIAKEFISLSLQGYYFLSKEEDYINFAFNYLPVKIKNQCNNDLEKLDSIFAFRPLSLFIEISSSESKKEDKIRAFKDILIYADWMIDNKDNLNKVFYNLSEVNTIVLFLKFFINVNYSNIYLLILFIIFIVENIFVIFVLNKYYSLNKNKMEMSMIEFFIYLNVYSPFLSFEKSINVLSNNDIANFKPLLEASYQHNENEFFLVKEKYNDDKIKNYLMLVYHLTYLNKIKNYDFEEINDLKNVVLKSHKNNIINLNYLYLLVIMFNVYYILVCYGKI